jgi:hypothetical protein
MKNSLSQSKLVALTIGVVSAVSVASATPGPVVYNFTGETGGGVVMGIHTSDYVGGALIGEFNMTTTTPGYNNILTYCTDVGAILASPYTYTPTQLSSATGVAPLWIAGGIQNAATLWANNRITTETANSGGFGYSVAIQTAGLQLAIWDLLYNNFTVGGTYNSSIFYNTSSTSFYLYSTDTKTTDAVAYADYLLNNFGGASSITNSVAWLAPLNGGSQGLLEMTPPGTFGNPPAPDAASTLGLLGMALAAVGVASKRFGAK